MTDTQHRPPPTTPHDDLDMDPDHLDHLAGEQEGAEREGVEQEEAAGGVAWVDPATLVLGPNTRTDPRLDKAFVRDIAARGVRQPIPVRRREYDGALVIRTGKRRALAALEAGLARVRVFIEPGPVVTDDEDDTTTAAASGTADKAARVELIVDQLGENHHRTGHTDSEEVAAHQQLLDLGLTVGQIARRRRVPLPHVKATVAVAGSELATAVLDRYDLTLDEAAVIAEFDDGTPEGTEAVKVLTVTASRERDQFPQVAQRLRDARAERRALAERITELRSSGLRVLDPDGRPLPPSAPSATEPRTDPTAGTSTSEGAPDSAGDGASEGTVSTGSPVRITSLRATPDARNGAELTAQAHAGCPGHAVSVESRRAWSSDPATVTASYWCTDPDRYGHVARYDRIDSGTAGTREPGPMTEQAKAEMRRVRTNNKDWDSATTVRHRWLREFLARRSAPKDTAGFIAMSLARGNHDMRRAMENGHPTACKLLGMEPGGGLHSYAYTGRQHPIAVAVETATPARVTMLTLALLLGAAEDGTSRDSWRRPSAETRLYFAWLADHGYPISPVEQLVCATTSATTSADADDAADVDEAADAAGVVASIEDTSPATTSVDDGAGEHADTAPSDDAVGAAAVSEDGDAAGVSAA